MSRRHLPFYLLTSFFTIAASVIPCLGQMEGPSFSFGYQVSGTVRDAASSQGLDGIRVELLTEGMSLQVFSTDNEGGFTFSGVRNGQYDIRVSADGYDSTEQSVEVSGSSVYGIAIDLKKSAGTAPFVTGGSVSAHQLGVPPKARKEFDKALNLMSSKSDYRGAVAEFDRAIQDFPNYYEAYAMEGVSYLAVSDATSAERVLRKSIDLSSSKYPVALCMLAGLLNATNRFAEAESTARQCIALDESSPQGHSELAQALLGLRRLDEALASALRARELGPKDPKVFLLLANIHGARLEYAAFLQDLDSYLALNPTGPMADRIRKKRDQAQQALSDMQQAAPTTAAAAQPAQPAH
jgi:Carboxypeptidase regulatory-like domain/Tetratricopeptide repeat